MMWRSHPVLRPITVLIALYAGSGLLPVGAGESSQAVRVLETSGMHLLPTPEDLRKQRIVIAAESDGRLMRIDLDGGPLTYESLPLLLGDIKIDDTAASGGKLFVFSGFGEKNSDIDTRILHEIQPGERRLPISVTLERYLTTPAITATRDDTRYLGNEGSNTILAFHSKAHEKFTPPPARFDPDLGIRTNLRNISNLELIDDERVLVATDGPNGSVRFIHRGARQVLKSPIRIDTRPGNWLETAVLEKQGVLVGVETGVMNKGGAVEATVFLVDYELELGSSIDLRRDQAFTIGSLFGLDLLTQGDYDRRGPVVKVAVNGDENRIALYSRNSNTVVIYDLAASYIERSNVITLPQRVRTVTFVDGKSKDTDSLVLETTRGLYLYDDVRAWNTTGKRGFDDVREAQRYLAELFSAEDAPSERFLVDGYPGPKTTEAFARFAKRTDTVLPKGAEAAARAITKRFEQESAASLSRQFALAPAVFQSLEEVVITAEDGLSLTSGESMRGRRAVDAKACGLSESTLFNMPIWMEYKQISSLPVFCLSTSKQTNLPLQIDRYFLEESGLDTKSKTVVANRKGDVFFVSCEVLVAFAEDEIVQVLSTEAASKKCKL